MKNTILALLYFILFSINTNAQTFNAIHLSVGQLNGAPDPIENEDWLWRSFPEFLNGKKGYFAEGMVFMEIKPKFSIGAGIHYSQLKFTHLVTGIQLGEDILNGTTTSFTKNISLKNIGIPVQVGYDIFEKIVKLQGHAGMLALKTFTDSSKTIVTGAGANDSTIAAQKLGETYKVKGINMAAYFGLELSYPITENNLVKIGGRYQWFFFSDKEFYENAMGNILAKGISIGFEHRIK